MYEDLIKRLIAYPQRGQVKVDFDLKKRVFRLSVPIFASKPRLPLSIKNYVDARRNFTFKPHTTSFLMEGQNVLLVQEFPFAADFQSTLRKQADAFWLMSKRCHQMFSEMAIEERYKTALHLDTHFGE